MTTHRQGIRAIQTLAITETLQTQKAICLSLQTHKARGWGDTPLFSGPSQSGTELNSGFEVRIEAALGGAGHLAWLPGIHWE